MPWIESHDSLESHPKLLALAAAMQWNEFETSGRLHAFWKWCLRFAPTGDLHRYNDAVIGKAVALNGDAATRFVEAMTSDQSCWIDRGSGPDGQSIFRVHDWPDYTRKYLRDSLFRDRPEKWKEVLAVYAVPLKKNSRVNHHARAAPTVPTKPTVPVLSLSAHAREDIVTPPIDPHWPKRITDIHGWYCEQMGVAPRVDSGVEGDWFRWFLHGFEEDDFKRVFKFIRAGIAAGERNKGALKLSNLLEPTRFGEDLTIAKQEFSPAITKQGETKKTVNGAQMVAYNDELRRIDGQIQTLRSSYDTHQSISPEDRAKLKKLRERREVVKKLLGVEV